MDCKVDTTEWVYLNGDFVPQEAAKISLFDRSVLFADSVYEVSAVLDGRLVDFDAHIARLGRSCAGLGMSMPLDLRAWRQAHEALIKRNDLKEGLVYLQVTGGVSPRDFLIDRTLAPTIFMFSQPKALIDATGVKTGLKIITIDDQRWARRDIKTTQLLSQSLARTQAVQSGCDDAWFVTDGIVNEGASSNAFIVTDTGVIRTRPGSHTILSGITCQAIIDVIKAKGLKFDDRPFSVQDALDAREAFSTSATSFIMPIVEIDNHKIGTGRPGAVTLALRHHYIERLRA